MNINLNLNSNIIAEKDDNISASAVKRGEAGDYSCSKNQEAVKLSIGENNTFIKNEERDFEEVQDMASVTDEKLMKDYMTVMSSSVSDCDLEELRENGFKPSEMEPDEMVNIVDEIKATVAKSGKVIYGYNDNLSREALEAVTGSAVYAEAIRASFAENDVPLTEENAEGAAAAISEAQLLRPMEGSEINFLIENKLSPTIFNLYKAQHSGSGAEKPRISELPQEMLTEETLTKFDGAVEEAGLEVNSDSRAMVKAMLELGIEISGENIEEYQAVSELELPPSVKEAADKISYAIKDGKKPEEADLTSRETLYDKAVRLTDEIKKRLTREESRLSLTVSATYTLLKNNIDIDFSDLNRLVENLKEAENRQFEAVFGKNTEIDPEEAGNILEDTVLKTEEMKDMPVAAVGVVSVRSSFSLNVLYEEASTLKNEYERAGTGYETMMTKVRGDLGDSLKKAFESAGGLLEGLGMEKTPLKEKAVRVLGYNGMEITKESVGRVEEALTRTQTVLDKMNPARTLSLIREGVNPLEISFEELENKLNKMDTPANTPDRFARFLCELDDRHEISEQEKDSFIGIYRLINQIEKNDMAAVGSLINCEMEINFDNLLTAVRTAKKSGMDVKVGDENGELEELITKGVSISEQIGRAFVNLNAFDEEASGEDRQKQNETYQQYVREENELVRRAGNAGEEAVKILENMETPATVENLAAFNEAAGGGLYGGIKKRLKTEDTAFDNIIKKALDNFEGRTEASAAYEEMTDSLKELINDNAVLTENISDLRGMSQSIAGLFVAERFSREEYYSVPVDIGGEAVDMSVRFKKGDDRGVEISFESQLYGRVSGGFSYENNSLSGLFAVSLPKGLDLLKEKSGHLTEALSDLEVEITGINFIKSDRVNVNIFPKKADEYNNGNTDSSKGMEEGESKDAISARVLYKVAKTFMTVISQ